MDFFFLVLLVILFIIFGYAQLHRGVVKTPSRVNLNEKEKIEFR